MLLKFFDNISAFPHDCSLFNGPYSLNCYSALWLKFGCTKEGDDYPANISDAERRFLSQMNLL